MYTLTAKLPNGRLISTYSEDIIDLQEVANRLLSIRYKITDRSGEVVYSLSDNLRG